ncbi:MAG: hypothetical protein OER80_08445 [Gammaproteobacteria bacterium]|nr:hypothetical protein [Gammaproteobacteria bacterium]
MITSRTIEIFNDPRFTLFVVESVDFQRVKLAAGCYLSGNIEPRAVIVRSPDATTALDMLGNPVGIEQLRQELSGLDDPL